MDEIRGNPIQEVMTNLLDEYELTNGILQKDNLLLRSIVSQYIEHCEDDVFNQSVIKLLCRKHIPLPNKDLKCEECIGCENYKNLEEK